MTLHVLLDKEFGTKHLAANFTAKRLHLFMHQFSVRFKVLELKFLVADLTLDHLFVEVGVLTLPVP